MQLLPNEFFLYPGEQLEKKGGVRCKLVPYYLWPEFRVSEHCPQIRVKTKKKSLCRKLVITSAEFLDLLKLLVTFLSKCPGSLFWCGGR